MISNSFIDNIEMINLPDKKEPPKDLLVYFVVNDKMIDKGYFGAHFLLFHNCRYKKEGFEKKLSFEKIMAKDLLFTVEDCKKQLNFHDDTDQHFAYFGFLSYLGNFLENLWCCKKRRSDSNSCAQAEFYRPNVTIVGKIANRLIPHFFQKTSGAGVQNLRKFLSTGQVIFEVGSDRMYDLGPDYKRASELNVSSFGKLDPISPIAICCNSLVDDIKKNNKPFLVNDVKWYPIVGSDTYCESRKKTETGLLIAQGEPENLTTPKSYKRNQPKQSNADDDFFWGDTDYY